MYVNYFARLDAGTMPRIAPCSPGPGSMIRIQEKWSRDCMACEVPCYGQRALKMTCYWHGMSNKCIFMIPVHARSYEYRYKSHMRECVWCGVYVCVLRRKITSSGVRERVCEVHCMLLKEESIGETCCFLGVREIAVLLASPQEIQCTCLKHEN
jgi:hypothetical protein